MIDSESIFSPISNGAGGLISLTYVQHIKKTMIFYDSLNILPSSLKALAKDFKLDLNKGDYPHKFASLDTLEFKGSWPDKSYYFDATDHIEEGLFDFRMQSIKYL